MSAATAARAQQTRALVIEGQADPAQLEQVQREFGALELEGEPEILLVTPEQAAQVRTRLESFGLDVEGVDQHYFSVLAPAGDTAGVAQRAQLEELASTPDTRVTVLRSQPAQLTALAFSGRLSAPQGFVTDTEVGVRRGAFTIELGGGRNFVLTPETAVGELWSGVSGDAVADLVYADGLISGSIQTPTASIQILPLGDGLYAAVEAPKSTMGDDSADMPMSPTPTGPPSAAACPASDPCVITIGVVYSREAATAAGPNATHALVTTPIQYLRGTLTHAGLGQRIQLNAFSDALVLDGPPNEPQRASVRIQREELLSPEDNSWEAEVREWRQQNNIDVVVMVGRWTSQAEDLCGKAGEVGYQHADRAYVVVNFAQFCDYSQTFGHEFGHLLGMAHDRRTLAIQTCGGNSPACVGFPSPPAKGTDRTSYLLSVDQFCATHQGACPTPGPTLGYCAAAGSVTYGTLMSYPWNCANSGYVGRPWWSNRVKQVPGTSVNIGDALANQVARLPEAARRVATHSEHLN